MATANPLPPLPDAVEMLDDFRTAIGELMAAGLDGEQLVDALAGPVVPDPPELTAHMTTLCAITR
jgi:hypothetical protein